jgi:hypothetical protein
MTPNAHFLSFHSDNSEDILCNIQWGTKKASRICFQLYLLEVETATHKTRQGAAEEKTTSER